MDDTRTVRGSTRINTKFYSEVCMTEATRYRGESNFIMDLKETVYEGAFAFHLALCRS